MSIIENGMIPLKDGYRVPVKEFYETIKKLDELMEHHSIALFDLVQKCRNKTHSMITTTFEESKPFLQKAELLAHNGHVASENIRRIVLNYIEMEGLRMKKNDPVKDFVLSNCAEKRRPSGRG